MTFPKEEELERGTRKISLNGDKDNHDDSGLPDDTPGSEEKAPVPKAKPVPKEDIFGQAKPVDTAAREKEIEERINREREERMRAEKEKREKEREAPDEEKKDVIVIHTESSRRRDETNWRKQDEPPTNGSGALDNKNRHMGGSGGGVRHIGRSKFRLT